MCEKEETKPICLECGGENIDILDGEGVAICTDCWLEWDYDN